MFNLVVVHVMLVLFVVNLIIGCFLVVRGVRYSKIISLGLGALLIYESQYMIKELITVIKEFSK